MTEEDPRILELREMRKKVQQGGGAERIARQHAKGKHTARERLELLLDPGTFQEIEAYAMTIGDEQCLPVEKSMGDGVVTGYGRDRRPDGFRLRAGFHRSGWGVGRDPQPQDLPGDGYGRAQRRARSSA